MVHQDDNTEGVCTIKQVEFNTIASSFGGLSTQTSYLHKYVLRIRSCVGKLLQTNLSKVLVYQRLSVIGKTSLAECLGSAR